MRVLLGLEKPDRGTVHRRKDLRIGYVPQRFDSDAVIPMTVERFLHARQQRQRRRPSPRSWRTSMPQSVRNQQLGELSGGELQRVLLARALLRQPNLLVLDEPVQGVDYTGEADLYNLIARLRDEAGFGVLLVSHDLHIVMARSDRVICLNRHVCCSGVPETVAQHPAYGRLFGAEAARAFAVYRHHHDHSHDLAGVPHPRRRGMPPIPRAETNRCLSRSSSARSSPAWGSLSSPRRSAASSSGSAWPTSARRSRRRA